MEKSWKKINITILQKILKKDSEGKDYPETEFKRENKKTKTTFFEFLIVNAEKGTYDKGYMEKRRKKNQYYHVRTE